MNSHLPQEHKGGWGSQKWLRTQQAPQTHTPILQLCISKHKNLHCSPKSNWFEWGGDFYTQGTLPGKGKSFQKKIHLTIYESLIGFLKHLLCTGYLTNYWVGLKLNMDPACRRLRDSWNHFIMEHILWARHSARLSKTLSHESSQLHSQERVIAPSLQMNIMKLREVSLFVQGHTACKC